MPCVMFNMNNWQFFLITTVYTSWHYVHPIAFARLCVSVYWHVYIFQMTSFAFSSDSFGLFCIRSSESSPLIIFFKCDSQMTLLRTLVWIWEHGGSKQVNETDVKVIVENKSGNFRRIPILSQIEEIYN